MDNLPWQLKSTDPEVYVNYIHQQAHCKHNVDLLVMSCGKCIGENYQLVKEFRENEYGRK